MILRDDPLHPGLLEHDLADAKVVRIGVTEPGEVPPVQIIPVEDPALEAGDVELFDRDWLRGHRLS